MCDAVRGDPVVVCAAVCATPLQESMESIKSVERVEAREKKQQREHRCEITSLHKPKEQHAEGGVELTSRADNGRKYV